MVAVSNLLNYTRIEYVHKVAYARELLFFIMWLLYVQLLGDRHGRPQGGKQAFPPPGNWD